MGRTVVVGAGGALLLPPRERALMAALALRSPAVVSADELVWMVWAGGPPVTARKSLQNHMVRVRGAGGGALVVTSDAGYHLGPGVVTDVEEAETLLGDARAARGDQRWARRLELVEACSQLRRGRPYADLPDTVEVVGERGRLDELLCQVDEDVTETLLVMGRPLEAVARLERLVTEEPYRERRWEQLLAGRFLIGKSADRSAGGRHGRRHTRRGRLDGERADDAARDAGLGR
ncbi:MAG: hypothetical protein M3137_04680 [Actinomycetota bacterium]|nr:hypothetical protein [Actinomycetota bacterium]